MRRGLRAMTKFICCSRKGSILVGCTPPCVFVEFIRPGDVSIEKPASFVKAGHGLWVQFALKKLSPSFIPLLWRGTRFDEVRAMMGKQQGSNSLARAGLGSSGACNLASSRVVQYSYTNCRDGTLNQ